MQEIWKLPKKPQTKTKKPTTATTTKTFHPFLNDETINQVDNNDANHATVALDPPEHGLVAETAVMPTEHLSIPFALLSKDIQ